MSNKLESPSMSLEEIIKKLQKAEFYKNDLVISALNQAIISHAYQLRDNGTSYVKEHIYPVVSSVINFYLQSSLNLNQDVIAGAFLHDVLEDDENMTDNKFIDRFGQKIYGIVLPLTKKADYRDFPGKDIYEKKLAMDEQDYFPNLQKASFETIVIKAADRLNNILCLHNNRNKDKISFYIYETRQFYLPLFENKGSLTYFTDQIKERLDIFSGIILKKSL